MSIVPTSAGVPATGNGTAASSIVAPVPPADVSAVAHANGAAGAAGAAGTAAEASPAPRGVIAECIVAAAAPAVRLCAQAWAQRCQHDTTSAIREALGATLELAGLPSNLHATGLMVDPKTFVAGLPEWVTEKGLDLASYPLSPTVKYSRRSLSNFERFWALGLGAQNPGALLESHAVEDLSQWLLVMSQAAVRSVRHTATIAALAVGEALGHHHLALGRIHDTLKRQLEASSAGRNARQEAQLQRALAEHVQQAQDMYKYRMQMLESTVPFRSRDVSEVIRLYTLTEVERLMKQDPEMYLQNKWTARVFLMIHDPSVEVRQKALGVVYQWYATPGKRSTTVQEHLNRFAERALSHLVERVGDVDSKVAVAALRCLRLPTLAERLEDAEFDTIVNLCVGSTDATIREESALFINSHVFQDPGICSVSISETDRKRARSRKDDVGGDGDEDNDPDADVKNLDVVKELYNSETSLSMLVEYLENYVCDHMRICERVVSAFWGRAPSLVHWGTMVNLCLVGENQRSGVKMDAATPRQRLALLYIMEASVRRVSEDVQTLRGGEKDAAVVKLNDACAHVIPELPRLFEICRPEEHQSLLLSHVCKILVEYAVENSQSQVVVNSKALCLALRKSLEGNLQLDTAKYCADALIALARCFDEAKTTFLDIAKRVHRRCCELLDPKVMVRYSDELVSLMGQLVVLSNRGIDMTFGKVEMLNTFIALINSRVTWLQENSLGGRVRGDGGAALETHSRESAAEAPEGGVVGDSQPQVQGVLEVSTPPGIPDARLALHLVEAAATATMWHVRMAFWTETKASEVAMGQGSEDSRMSAMLQGLGEHSSVRIELPRAVSSLRSAFVGLITHERCPYVQLHAYSSFMCTLQLAVGVSERLGLDVSEAGKPVVPGVSGTYDVSIPEIQIQALWQYLNNFYVLVTTADVDGISFNVDGQRIVARDVYPAPSQGTLTSARFSIQRYLQAAGKMEGETLTRETELMFAVLASRMVLESELEDVYAGPLGLLLLTQCERGRPKPLRDVALALFRRLRELARTTEEFAIQFYRLQEEALDGVFECVGIDAAQSLNSVFTRQWGPRVVPWLEQPLFTVLKDAVVGCVTEDKRRLQLLEIFSVWMRPEFVNDMRGREIVAALLSRCTELGFQGELQPAVVTFVRKVLPTQDHAAFLRAPQAPLPSINPSFGLRAPIASSAAGTPVPPASSAVGTPVPLASSAVGTPVTQDEAPPTPQSLNGKRPLESSPLESAPPTPQSNGVRTRKRGKTTVL